MNVVILSMEFIFFTFVFVIVVCIRLCILYKKEQKKNKELHIRLDQTDSKSIISPCPTQSIADIFTADHLSSNDLFFNLSHELKTPLSVILGAIQLIESKGDIYNPPRRKSDRHLITIRQNAFRLLRLVNNILDISRLDIGYMKLCPENINIVYLIEEIVHSVIPYAEQKKISMEFDTEKEEIITAVDVDKLERITLNLLSNAIKFTDPAGKIAIHMRANHSTVLISVKDNGIGIPKEKQSSIFERFSQANTALSRVYEGTGIGLSIVKSFVDLHCGQIEVHSDENKGSEFIIKLPISLCKQSSRQEPQAVKQSRIINAINVEFSDIYTVNS